MEPTQHEIVRYNMREEFQVDCNPNGYFEGYKDGLPHVPKKKAYHFDMPRLLDMMAFWSCGERALKIKGDPAAGKTSLVEQFHARMRAPLLIVSCSQGLEQYHLYGQLLPNTEGKLRWVDGPVIAAARNGWSVLLDEYNTLDPNCSTSLNALLEGYSITIPETGEVITPHGSFRAFATENPVTSKLTVAGRNVQDVANDDRWMNMEVDYLPAAQEIGIVKGVISQFIPDDEAATQQATILVTTANNIRGQFRANHESIDRPMSTRVLQRWARLLRMYQHVQRSMRDELNAPMSPIVYALPRAFTTSSAEMKRAVTNIARKAIGLEEI